MESTYGSRTPWAILRPHHRSTPEPHPRGLGHSVRAVAKPTAQGQSGPHAPHNPMGPGPTPALPREPIGPRPGPACPGGRGGVAQRPLPASAGSRPIAGTVWGGSQGAPLT